MFLYVMHDPETDIIKLGVSRDVAKRLKTHRENSGRDQLYTFWIKSFDDTFRIETLAKLILEPHRKIGEWYKIKPKTAVNEILKIVNSPDRDDYVRKLLLRQAREQADRKIAEKITENTSFDYWAYLPSKRKSDCNFSEK